MKKMILFSVIFVLTFAQEKSPNQYVVYFTDGTKTEIVNFEWTRDFRLKAELENGSSVFFLKLIILKIEDINGVAVWQNPKQDSFFIPEGGYQTFDLSLVTQYRVTPTRINIKNVGGGLIALSGICGLVNSHRTLNLDPTKDADELQGEIAQFASVTRDIQLVQYISLTLGGLFIILENLRQLDRHNDAKMKNHKKTDFSITPQKNGVEFGLTYNF